MDLDESPSNKRARFGVFTVMKRAEPRSKGLVSNSLDHLFLQAMNSPAANCKRYNVAAY